MRRNPKPAPDEEAQRLAHIEALTRKQLSRRMHDGLTQSVAALAMRAELARRLLATDPGAATKELEALEDLARRTTRDLRQLQLTLMPQSLETLGLASALRDLVTSFEKETGQKIVANLEEIDPDQLEPNLQLSLFYIACEAAENAIRHAKASQISLRLSRPERAVVLLEVEDDGIGFDAKTTEAAGQQNRQYGLAILRERVLALRGELHIESPPGRGCKLRIAVPARRRR